MENISKCDICKENESTLVTALVDLDTGKNFVGVICEGCANKK